MEEPIRPPFAMKVTIGWDGEAMSVKSYDDKDAPEGNAPSDYDKIKEVNHVVSVYTKNPTCVTYQTPRGPRTV